MVIGGLEANLLYNTKISDSVSVPVSREKPH